MAENNNNNNNKKKKKKKKKKNVHLSYNYAVHNTILTSKYISLVFLLV